MKLNTAWLLRYLDTPIPHRALVDAMPRAGLEVEAEVELKADLKPVKIGFVREKTSIEGAPGMFATIVEIEKGKRISVLVGSEHEVQIGWGVPVALAGTTLPTGKKVAAGKFHGIESVGMICLDGEMGLIARETGLYHTADESQMGKSIVDVIDIPEFLIELKVLPNRPDCLGLLGISREIAAIFNVKTKWPELQSVTAGDEAKIDVRIEEPTLCARLTAAAFGGVKVGPSPGWLKAVLLTAGMRPINNIVDITNFVMWETGQPMHAFDLAKVAKRQIVVRKLRDNESLELLTGKTITTKYGQPLCICDADKPLGLAGIMGGKLAETAGTTSELLLEVAYFDPVHIRGNVKSVRKIDGAGGTDASYRFERGVDPNAVLDWARHRAYGLIAELSGATLSAPPTDIYPKRIAPKVFTLDAESVSRMIGMPVDAQTIRKSLLSLGYGVDANLIVTVPTYRVDVNDRVVLMEDVARLIDYDNIPMGAAIGAPTRGQDAKTSRLRTAIADQLVSVGWYETKNDPLEAANASKWMGAVPDAITLANAATNEMSVLRRSLLTGLLASTQRNIFRGASRVRLFEIDRTFQTLPGAYTLSGIAGGVARSAIWRGGEAKIDFFTLKGEIEDLFDSLGITGVTFAPAIRKPFKPGETAQIALAGNVIGHVGLIDTAVVKIERQTYSLYGFEIDLTHVTAAFDAPIVYRSVNKLPPSTRDLAIVVKSSEPFATLESIIRTSAGDLLESVQLVDEYRGNPVPKDHRSLAFRLTYRAADRTLTADEVQVSVDRVVASLSEKTGATLRA